MNAFSNVSIHAREGRLVSPAASYYASEAFRERSEIKGDTAQQDRLKVQHHMLGFVALNPRDVPAMREQLARGSVQLYFFGVSNPVTMFSVDVGSREHAELLVAFEANVASRMFKAAQRVQKWRTPRKVADRNQHEDAVLARLLAMNPWADASVYRTHPGAAKSVNDAVIAKRNAKLTQIRAQRSVRLALLAHAATPGLTNWTDFVENIALQVLTPPVH